LQGPNVGLYDKMKKEFPTLYVIASGGIASLDDIMTLDAHGIDAVITGKAIYEGKITLKDIAALHV